MSPTTRSPSAERQRLHLRVANKLSSPETADRYPRTIAFHLEQAALASLDLNPRDRTLAERAAEALANAGDLARRRIESRSAADLFQRALALSGPEDGWGEHEAWCLAMLGESRYWLGEFDLAESALNRALVVAGDGRDRVTAHASRFLADIMLTIRGDDERAAELFARSLEAARRLGDPYVLSRTLLMAGWVPFWRNELARAEAMFREALEVARSEDRRDAWAESRALVGLANVTSATADEQDALVIALEALQDRGGGAAGVHRRRRARDGRGLAPAPDAARRSPRACRARGVDAAGARRPLGAGERARRPGRDPPPGRPTRATVSATSGRRSSCAGICRNGRSSPGRRPSSPRSRRSRGDTGAARLVLGDPVARTAEGEPGSATALLVAEAIVALVEGDIETALAKSLASIDAEGGPRGAPNARAAQVWWTGSRFGAEAVGGAATLVAARERLERNGWRQALIEPDQAADLAR